MCERLLCEMVRGDLEEAFGHDGRAVGGGQVSIFTPCNRSETSSWNLKLGAFEEYCELLVSDRYIDSASPSSGGTTI